MLSCVPMIITPTEAGAILGVSERRVRQMAQAGIIKSEAFGRAVAVDKASVLRLKEKRSKKESSNGKG